MVMFTHSYTAFYSRNHTRKSHQTVSSLIDYHSRKKYIDLKTVKLKCLTLREL